MDKSITYEIDNILNVFSSKDISEIISNYNLSNYYYLNQIHSNKVLIVDNDLENGGDGDALITNRVNTPITIKTADCIPILLYDKVNKVIAVVHSGWKGTLNNITKKTIEKMINVYNSKPSDISVYFYPSIKICHFEIESDVLDEFKSVYKNIDKFMIDKHPKYYLDLESLIIDYLKSIGVTDIHSNEICTCCHPDTFHSYRYNHTDKRNTLLAMIKE